MKIQRQKIDPAILRSMKDHPVFYRKVWLACAGIPRGETVSYGELARRVGCPRGARAVAMALARNPFAPAIPCHRVIRADGTIGGYSAPGGTARKRALLKSEGNKNSSGRD